MKKTELIFLGPPASGKGTQTKKLSAELGLPHVDMGGMLREAISNGTEAGLEAKKYMDEGKLVPLEIVKQIVVNRLVQSDCANGFVLDGFPRSIEQAEVLNDILADLNSDLNKGVDVNLKVINIDLNQDVLVERIVNRRSCADCGKIYNLKFSAPKAEGVCDDCGGQLIQRGDDTEEVASKRFATYFTSTEPLIKYYTDKGLLTNVNGDGSIDEVYVGIKKAISGGCGCGCGCKN